MIHRISVALSLAILCSTAIANPANGSYSTDPGGAALTALLLERAANGQTVNLASASDLVALHPQLAGTPTLYHTSTPLKLPLAVEQPFTRQPLGVPVDCVANEVVPLVRVQLVGAGEPSEMAVAASSLLGGGGAGLQATCSVPHCVPFTVQLLFHRRTR